MEQYISKSALVAEIESLKSAAETMLTGKMDLSYWKAQKHLCERILSFINALEVKEIDFENEIDRIWFSNKFGEYFDNDAVDFARIRTICKHFFEFGLKTQKGE